MNNTINKSKIAFSLVEIMFVIAIITFLSASSVTYFNNFVDSKRLETDMFLINNKIETLNTKVNNREIYDYEIIFSSSKDYLTYNLNQSIKKSNTILLIDNYTKDYTMSTNIAGAGTWDIKIYSDNKKIKEKIIDQTFSFTGNMSYYLGYDITSGLVSGQDLLGIQYYSEENLNSLGVKTNFIGANTKEDKSGLSSSSFTLKNVNSKIRFYSGSTLWDNKEVYLFFEKAGLEKSIKISK